MKQLLYFIVMLSAIMGTVSCSNREDTHQKWEYRTLVVYANANDGDYDKFVKNEIPVPYAKLAALGAQGWELVDVFTETETVHPNFGDPKYVTGIQPNTRTYRALYVFKRPLIKGQEQNTHSVEIVSEEVVAVEDSIVGS